MDCVRIQTDATERVEALMLDGSLSPVTGLSNALLSIRRVSDGFWYDFSDDTFKSSGWTTRQQIMTETDSTNDQGVYHYNFDTSAITNASADDTYELRVDCASATNVPQTGEIKVGQFVDDVDAAISSRAPSGEYDTEIAALIGDITFIKDIEGGRWNLVGGQMIFYEDDNTTEVARFDITTDVNGNPIERTRV